MSRWHDLLKRTLLASTTDRVSLAAAGCAFYATLALFPAISMMIAVVGMVLDPVTAEQQLSTLSGLLPPPAYSLIEDRVHQLVGQTGGNLSAHLLISFLLTFWSSSTGSKSILSAINVAYDVTEQRPFSAVSGDRASDDAGCDDVRNLGDRRPAAAWHRRSTISGWRSMAAG